MLVSAKADGATISTRPTVVPVNQALTLGKPRSSLTCGARSGRHDVEALPAVGKLAISYVPHHHTCPDRARKTRPDLAGQT
eukprot:928298-Alexandrium_andersonii.AAC.1